MAQLMSLLLLAVMIFAIVDAITSDNWQIRYLPKVAWVIVIILLPLIGSILWFVIGKERTAPVSLGSFGDPRRTETLPARSSTEDDLAAVEREIAFHEKQAEIRRLEARIQERRAIDPNS